MPASIIALIHGLLFGLVSACSLGPIFFAIIETSIAHGFRKAIGVAFGVLISDSLFIALSFLAIQQLHNESQIKSVIGFAGGSLLIVFGIYNFFKQAPDIKSTVVSERFSLLYFIKGFIINSLNPFVTIFWMSAVSVVEVDRDYVVGDKILFFVVAVSCNFSFDVIKSLAAARLKLFLNAKHIHTMYKVVGTALILFGAHLLCKAVFHYC